MANYKMFVIPDDGAEDLFRSRGEIPRDCEWGMTEASSEEEAEAKTLKEILDLPYQDYRTETIKHLLKVKFYKVLAIRTDHFGLVGDTPGTYAINCIYKGNPITYDDYSLFDDCFTDEKKDKCIAWVHEFMVERKTPNRYHTSYGLKHLLERDTGIYMTNNQFKSLMLKCGHYPVSDIELNWTYRISEKPLTRREKERREGKTWVYQY